MYISYYTFIHVIRLQVYFYKSCSGQAKIQRTSKNMQQYYMLKLCLISYYPTVSLVFQYFVNISEHKESS